MFPFHLLWIIALASIPSTSVVISGLTKPRRRGYPGSYEPGGDDSIKGSNEKIAP
jgi:hypothetical protein